MSRKKQQQVTLVGVRGAKLPVTDCLLVDVDSENLTVQAVQKTRGRGANVLRTYVLPKALVQYHYYDEDLVAGAEVDVPVVAKPAAKPRKSKAAAADDAVVADAPKRRGRPKGSKNKVVVAAAEAEAGEPVVTKKAGRPPKKTIVAAASAPKKRGRKKVDKSNGAPEAPKGKKASVAASLFDESF